MEQAAWTARAEAYTARASTWVEGRLDRRTRGERNALDDFLFDYYSYSPNKLVTWHPGHGVILEGPSAKAYLQHAGYHETAQGVTADIEFLNPKRQRLELAIRIIEGTMSRPPATGCFALHEWAMTYHLSQDEVRHASLPLRVSREEIAETVDSIGLRCTHIDAYRFFTPDAVPLNTIAPTRETQPDLEQPGCLHATMDLNSPQLRMLAPRLQPRSSRGTCCVARKTTCSRVPPAFKKATARSRPTRDSARRRVVPGVQECWRR